MVKTCKELLALADKYIAKAQDCAKTGEGCSAYSAESVAIAGWTNALANTAQACVMLAKELREAKEAPTYEQAERTIQVIEGISNAIWKTSGR